MFENLENKKASGAFYRKTKIKETKLNENKLNHWIDFSKHLIIPKKKTKNQK